MKKIKAIIIMLMISISAFSQESTVNQLLDEFLFGKSIQDSVLEAILLNEADLNDLMNALADFKYIYARSEFENKTYFSGQDLGIEQFNIANQVYYQGSKGLNIGLSGIFYSGFKPKYNTTIASIGYNNRIASLQGISVRTLYNRFFFAKVDSIEKNAYNNSINLGASFQSKNIGTSVDYYLLLGNDPSSQISWDLYSQFKLLKLGIFNTLKFVPEISLYFGNATVVSNQYVSQENKFGLMNSVIRLPVNLTYNNLDLAAGYNFNFPRQPDSLIKPERTSFFNISIGYMFGL